MKKKTNPGKVRVDAASIDFRELTKKASTGMVFSSWAVFLAALAGFKDTTQEQLLRLWDEVNAYSSSIHTYEDVADELKEIERIAGVHMPYETISTTGIRTQADVKRFQRKVERNATFSAYALIAGPILRLALYDEPMIQRLFQKAYDLDEELQEKRIKISDIQQMLVDEFGLLLEDAQNGAQLRVVASYEDLKNGHT